ncbi:MAG: hypothetical protein HYV26_05050 [Candidatus Hydrogenedentes bacterium]|nr:hypothetical protein [Candidatus Hydrogenedentota bacterium]MBI3119266.1 hypothetical protein [Candidatus Hydrogenedentota bacterium]
MTPGYLTQCKCLRCKEMYYQPLGAEEDMYSGGAYWCNKTHEGFGPDGQPAGRQECDETRDCYQR